VQAERARDLEAEVRKRLRPLALQATAAERALTGKPATAENIERAAAAVGEALGQTIGDSYASGEFRVHLAKVMTKRALTQLAGKGR